MKSKLFKSSVKAQQMDMNTFVQAISQPKTKVNDLLIAKLSFIGIILAFSGILIAIFGL